VPGKLVYLNLLPGRTEAAVRGRVLGLVVSPGITEAAV
jgi:hypothetical protein